MEWIYLSPHLDDAILSCGGLISDQINSGDQVTIITIFAGDPPAEPLSPYASMLHDRWGTGRDAVAVRRGEDEAACKRLGARFIHFDIPDCIYRMDTERGSYYYETDDAIFGEIDPGEAALITRVGELIKADLPNSARVVCPITLGNHIDHQITRQASEHAGIQPIFYADYPYVLYDTPESRTLDDYEVHPVSDNRLKDWQDAVAEYRSQISTFWYDDASMRGSIKKYWDKFQGLRLWKSV